MKKTKKIVKKALSVILSALMCFGVCAVCFTALPLKAGAAAEKSASAAPANVYFNVPEVIYLAPAGTGFQYYADQTMTVDTSAKTATVSANASANDTSGQLDFYYPNTSSVTITVSGASATVGGTEISASAGKTLSCSDAVAATAQITAGSVSSAASQYIVWKATYTDASDGKTKTAVAYSYVYAPNVHSVGGVADTHAYSNVVFSDDRFCTGSVSGWITGTHGLLDGDIGFGAFNTPDRAGYFTTDPITNLNSSASPTKGAELGNILTEDTTVYARQYYYGNSKESNAGSSERSGAGYIYVDDSRITNLNQVPNLKVGAETVYAYQQKFNWNSDFYAMYIASASTNTGIDSNTGFNDGKYTAFGTWSTFAYYRSDSNNTNIPSGITNRLSESVAYVGTEKKNSYADIANSAAMWDNACSGTNTRLYTGPNVTVDSSLNNKYLHTVVQSRYGDNGTKAAVFSSAQIFLNNKGALRNAVWNAQSLFAKLGVTDADATGNLTSCYFDSTSGYKWTEFVTAYKNAVLALTKLDASCSADSLASALNSAINALCTKVTLNVNGGSAIATTEYFPAIGGGNTVATNVSYTPSATTTRTGYTFNGWATSVNGTPAATFTLGYNQTLYAVWTPIQYTVSYNGNGATGGSTASQTFTYDTAGTLQNNGFEKKYTVSFDSKGGSSVSPMTAEATFNGWEDRGSFTFNGTTYPYTAFSAPFYANNYGDLKNAFGYNKYDLIQHYVNHGISEGRQPTGDISLSTYPQGASVKNLTTVSGTTVPLYAVWTPGSVTLPTVSKTGYTLEGWYTDSGLTNKAGNAGASYAVAASCTLYAKWTPNTYTVNFNANTGSCSTASKTVTYDSTYGTLPAAEKSGYSFAGWFTAAEGGEQITSDSVVAITGTQTLYAQYTAKQYKATFKKADGTVISENFVTFGIQPVVPAGPAKTFDDAGHYVFAGWTNGTNTYSAANIPVMGAADVTYTAVYNTVGHTWNNGTWTWADDGSAASVVIACTHTEGHSVTLDATVTSSVKTAATCTAMGVTLYSASATFNGSNYTSSKEVTDIAMVAHVYGDWTVVTAPTCAAKGQEKRVCANCPAYETRDVAIDPTAHAPSYAYVVKDAVAATCTANGYTGDLYCPLCDKKMADGEVIVADGHSYPDGWITLSVATCTEKGQKKEVCVKCGYEDIVDIPVDTNNHDYINHTAKAATCTEIGWNAYRTCSRCDYTTYVEIPAAGHDYVDHTAQAATCTEIGWNAYQTCTKCDYTSYAEIPALGHNWGDATCTDVATCSRCHISTGTALGHDFDKTITANVTVTPATCTAAGQEVVKCSRCDETQTTVIPATGHTGGTPVRENEVAAKCETAGSYDEVIYCTVCSAELSREAKTIPALGHTVKTLSAVAATCTETGLTEGSVCSECGKTLVAQEIVDALGHTDEIIPAVAATCTKTGLTQGVRCAVCKEILVAQTETAIVPHTSGEAVKENVVAATCTAKGSYDSVVYCTVCKKELSRESYETDMIEHRTVKVPGKAASCLKDGLTDGYKCAVCGTVTQAQETIPALGHDYVKKIKTPASCTREGVYIYTCSRCYDTYTENVDKLDHVAGEAKKENEVAATCKAGGSYDMVIRCVNCENVISSEHFTTDKAAHREVEIVAVPATCTATGLSAGVKCAVCGEILVVPAVTPKTAHKPVLLEDVAPTCTEEGYKNRTVCEYCGDNVGTPEIIPANGHTWGAWETIKEATATEDGYKERTCAVCGKIEKMVVGFGEQRLLKFYVLNNMYYVVENELKVTSSKNLYCELGNEVKFTVVTRPSFMFVDYIITIDGVEVSPDANGVYTIPAGVNNVIISATGMVEVPDKDAGSDSGEGGSGSSSGTKKLSFWEWLLMIFRKIAALFTGKKI